MKRYLSILLAAVTIFTIGCRKDNTKENENKETKASPTMILTATGTPTAEVQPSETPAQSSDEAAEATQSPEPTDEVPTDVQATETASTAPETGAVTSVPSTEAPVTPPTATPTITPSVKPTSTVKPTAKPTVNQTSAKPTATVTAVPKTPEPTATLEPTPVYGTKEYYKIQAAKTVEEINKRRNVQLIVLPGLTEYAEYRAMQLETNFAHDLRDQIEASTALKYGRYIDPVKWGDIREPYYQPLAAEAICIAHGVSADFWNSPGHWNYVGSDEYLYIGVGASSGGTCVCVANTNTDILSEFNREAEKKDCQIMYYVDPDGTHCVWNENTQNYSKVYSSLEQWYDDWKKGNMFGLQK